LPDLEAIRLSLRREAERYLKSLQLGKQAPAYKAAKKALDHLIGEVRG
jgi:hypothetical protein